MEQDDDFYDDENQVTDFCPSCGETYDDIDMDFSICSNCGYDANKKVHDDRHKVTSMKGFGIDPDVTHRIMRDNWM